ncbi:MAG TPA: outer membrane lipoprotein-sorting protein [Spirochaetia bacterium]|nr:outer membrane lipoprotein-sorting protein [Spirochaetia bacterium]
MKTKKNMILRLTIAIVVLVPALIFAAMTAEEVIRKMEKNQVHQTATSTGRLVITNRFGTKVKTFNVWTEGSDKMLIEFTNKEERGQKILRLADEIYVYYPKAEGVVRLQGGALKESIFGSDFTYEDLTGEKGFLDLYTVAFAASGTVEVEGVSCWHLKLSGKKPVAYPFQELWVDAEKFVMRKAVYYALNNTALKELTVEETMTRKGKIFPSRFLMRDLLRQNSTTEFILETIQIDVPLPANQFSLERLKF